MQRMDGCGRPEEIAGLTHAASGCVKHSEQEGHLTR